MADRDLPREVSIRIEPNMGLITLFWPATGFDHNDAAIIREGSELSAEIVNLLDRIINQHQRR